MLWFILKEFLLIIFKELLVFISRRETQNGSLYVLLLTNGEKNFGGFLKRKLIRSQIVLKSLKNSKKVPKNTKKVSIIGYEKIGTKTAQNTLTQYIIYLANKHIISTQITQYK